MLARIMSVHKLSMPTTTGGLSRLAKEEVDRFTSQMKELKFTDVRSARVSTLRASEMIHRLLDVGVLVSALAEAAEEKR
jgi:hypothetical protein